MGRSPEELRSRALAYRDAADSGPRRERAYQLTQAYCLEQQAGALERRDQTVLPGLFDGSSAARPSPSLDDSAALEFKPRHFRNAPQAADKNPGRWKRAFGRFADNLDEAPSDPFTLRS